jgi:hypothetical protein
MVPYSHCPAYHGPEVEQIGRQGGRVGELPGAPLESHGPSATALTGHGALPAVACPARTGMMVSSAVLVALHALNV